MHYCSTRHVMKPKGVPSPESPVEARPTTPNRVGRVSPISRGVADHPQPLLALPTNPILIVPYSLIQGASLLPAPAVGLHQPMDTAYFLLPDGTLQPMATAISSRNLTEKLPRPVNPFQSPSQPFKPSVEKPSHEQPSGSPLDLSCRRSAEKEVVVVVDGREDNKENRRLMNSQRATSSPEHEDIICAPSIPLMLSTSSTCSSPSPAPLSPASSSHSTSKRSDIKRHHNESAHSNSPSPKSSVISTSHQIKSPCRTPNGISSKTPISDRQTPEMQSTQINDNNNINLQSLLLAAFSSQSQMDNIHIKSELPNLPLPPELLPHFAAMYNARFSKTKNIPPILGLMPPGGNLQPLPMSLASRSPAEFLNQANLLLTPEMALRLATVSGSAELPPPAPVVPPPPPQVLVKQGDSKCQECNIVFYKHENYIAHKKHYCSARKLTSTESSLDEKTPSPPGANSPPVTVSPPKESKTKSPLGSLNNIPSTSKTMLQFICAACGIKYTSYDNLTAHQTYYCPKRNSNEPEKPRRCTKCKMAITGDHQCSGSSIGWKCPCCPVTSPTASAAQKHMDTHTGVKAFLCTICRYKGNTLRGMRTHIRMHFDRRPAEINEENYITCIVEESGNPSLTEPSIVLEEDIIGLQKDPQAATSSVERKVPSNGSTDSVKVKLEEIDSSDEAETERVDCHRAEDEEYVEIEDVPVKEEAKTEKIEDENVALSSPSDNAVVDDTLTTKTVNNNKSVGPRYCESCDISFTYLSTFIAHKKFYCSSHTGESTPGNNNNNNSDEGSNNNKPSNTPLA